MSDDLPSNARAILDLAKDADEANPADFRRVRRSLAATLLASSLVGTAGGAKAAVGAGAKTGLSAAALKWTGIGLAGLCAGGIALAPLVRDRPVEDTGARPAAALAADAPEPHAKARAAAAPNAITGQAPSEPPASVGHPSGAELEEPATARRRDDVERDPSRLAPHQLRAPGGASSPSEPTASVDRSARLGAEADESKAGAAPAQVANSHGLKRSTKPASGSQQVTRGDAHPPQTAAADRPESTGSANETPAVSSEVTLMQQASQALQSGQIQGALALLHQHAKTYPRGVLAEERRALHAIALCRAGSSRASAAAARFLKLSPESPLSARVRSECGSSGKQ